MTDSLFDSILDVLVGDIDAEDADDLDADDRLDDFDTPAPAPAPAQAQARPSPGLAAGLAEWTAVHEPQPTVTATPAVTAAGQALVEADDDHNPVTDDDYDHNFIASINGDDETPHVSTAQVVDLLNESVKSATNGAANRGRPGQEALLLNIWSTMTQRTHTLAAAPTGVGKSLAYLSAAASAAVRGERSVISTESLALQAQIIEKDLPVVAAATSQVHGKDLKFAILKGRSNFACALAAVQTANKLLEGTSVDAADSEAPLALADAIAAARPEIRAKGKVTIGGVETRAARLAAALEWALPTSIGVNPNDPQSKNQPVGDFDSAGDIIGDEMRQMLSSTSESCLGKDHCEFYTVCRAEVAKSRAAEADIVVTNHAMLGVQATKAIPVVIGSSRLGRFDHVIVDEAHALPSVVRSQGATDLSGPAIRRLVAACTRDTGLPNAVDKKISEGRVISERLDSRLLTFATDKSPRNAATGEAILLDEDDDPVGPVAESLSKWLSQTKRALAAHEKQLRTSAVGGLKVAAQARNRTRDQLVATRKAVARLDAVLTDIERARTPEPGIARWMEVNDFRGVKTASVELSPVNVSSNLDRCVWTGYEDEDENGPTVAAPCTEGAETYDLSVSCVSATIPSTFAREAGLRATPKPYESPFADAYQASRIYIPAMTPTVAGAVTNTLYGKPKFDMPAHQDWAAAQTVALVEANGGRALVLAATTKAGREYAEILRAAANGRWHVMSQWDAGTTGQLVAAWRADETAVLVGTKSLFTGVDAPGETCSLVVIDRIPRARMNPVDDARRDTVSIEEKIGRWDADLHVYVSDAAVTLEQGVGRLIRSVNDSGLVAVLDPRIGGGNQPQLSRGAVRTYLDAVGAFPGGNTRITTLDDATAFLKDRRNR